MPWGWDLGFRVTIEPQGLGLGLKAEIWASRLDLSPSGRDLCPEGRIKASGPLPKNEKNAFVFTGPLEGVLPTRRAKLAYVNKIRAM